MQTKGKKKFIRPGIIGYIQKIFITVIIMLVAVLILSLFIDTEFVKILRIVSLGALTIGLLSVVGSNKITYSPGYHHHKSMTGMTGTGKQDVNILHGSYSFFIFMSITAGILYLISSFF